MLKDELISLINKIKISNYNKQSIQLECANKIFPQSLYNSLSAFSNQSGGGIIVFGIDEENDCEICGVYNIYDIQQKLAEQCEQMEPPISPLFTVADINGKAVISCEIQECDMFLKPCYYKGAGKFKSSYIRCENQNLPMTEFEIYNYEVIKRNIYDDLRVDSRVNVCDLDENKISEYLKILRMQKGNLVNIDDTKLLNMLGILNGNTPTLCGTMLFCPYPQAYYPSLCVIINLMQDADNAQTVKIEGNLEYMFNEAFAFVSNNIKYRTQIRGCQKQQKPEYPTDVIKEVVLNALIHRDLSIYTEGTPIEINIFKDRLEVETPGGLYGRLTVDNISRGHKAARNPHIAAAAKIIFNNEKACAGIPHINSETKKYGLGKPQFENIRGTFKVTVFNNNYKAFMSFDERVIDFCATPKTREEISTHFGYNNPSYMISKYIHPLVESGRLKMTIPNCPKSKLQQYFAN